MRATERYERAWNAFQIHLNHNPKASLIPFLKERHVNHRSMHRWMSEKGYSVITGAVLFGGAAGNFIDRLFRGYVVDFIYFSLIDFPVFNIADIYVVCGGIVLVFLVVFKYKDEDFEFLSLKIKDK